MTHSRITLINGRQFNILAPDNKSLVDLMSKDMPTTVHATATGTTPSRESWPVVFRSEHLAAVEEITTD